MRIRISDLLFSLFLLWSLSGVWGSCSLPERGDRADQIADQDADAGDVGELRPAGLRCEYRIDPRGIDVASPRLGWIVESDRRGEAQSAYQILVASNPRDLERGRGTLWDSGKVLSDETLHVVYGGKELSSRQQCWWKVRVWDRRGGRSEWSPTALWTMGLLDRGDWQAEWITVPKTDRKAEGVAALRRWIWHPESSGDGARVRFRCEVELGPGDIALSLTLTADDHYRLFVNGTECGSDDQWKTTETYTLVQGQGLLFGKNVIAVEARNNAGPCGMLVAIKVEGPPGSAVSRLIETPAGGAPS